jgi:hypothetical protein
MEVSPHGETRRLHGVVKHLTMAIVAMVIYGALHIPLGRIPVANGAGWDGIDYVAMLEDGWKAGGPNTQLRPLVVWLAQPAYAVAGSPAQAFDITNYLFTGLLALLFSLLMDWYGASSLARWIAIVCVSVSNAYRLPAYYPVLIDLGGHAMMALAIWHIIAGPRWAAGLASIAAVLSREYAPVVLIFGAWRDRRLHLPLTTILATYLPAALIVVAVRMIVDARSLAEGNTLQTFIRNMGLWTGPLFPAFYIYFLLTIAGGVSLVLAAQPQRWWRLLREEPEWLGFALPIVLVTALVGLDIWRYLTALTPLVVVLFARCSREWRGREAAVLMSAVVVMTLATQMPFQGMDLTRYFTEWFPYYAWTDSAPVDVTRAMLWPGWTWRFLAVGVALAALIVYASGRGRTAVVTQRA